MTSSISLTNIDEATAAELQKYMEDHGVVEIKMSRIKTIWRYEVTLVNGGLLYGDDDSMGGCMKAIIHKLEEA